MLAFCDLVLPFQLNFHPSRATALPPKHTMAPGKHLQCPANGLGVGEQSRVPKLFAPHLVRVILVMNLSFLQLSEKALFHHRMGT